MKRASLLLLPLLALAGCKSAFIDVDVRNQTGGPITVLEVDYPSASFGKELVAAGTEFHYRIELIGSGATAVSWTDAAHTQHNYKGPSLNEGQRGSIILTLQPTDATWERHLQP